MFPQFTSKYTKDRGKHYPCPDYLQGSRCFEEEQGLEYKCADDVGGAVDQVDRVSLLELVRADGQGLLCEGCDHEQENLVAFQSTGGEAPVPHGKEEGDVDGHRDHPARGGQGGPVHVLEVAQDDGDDWAKGSDCYKGEGCVHHLSGVFNLESQMKEWIFWEGIVFVFDIHLPLAKYKGWLYDEGDPTKDEDEVENLKEATSLLEEQAGEESDKHLFFNSKFANFWIWFFLSLFPNSISGIFWLRRRQERRVTNTWYSLSL